MEIKSIEKQGDIVTVKMTMPEYCTDCPFETCCAPSDFYYCHLVEVKQGKDCNIFDYETNSPIPEFCPLRCNNG